MWIYSGEHIHQIDWNHAKTKNLKNYEFVDSTFVLKRKSWSIKIK